MPCSMQQQIRLVARRSRSRGLHTESLVACTQPIHSITSRTKGTQSTCNYWDGSFPPLNGGLWQTPSTAGGRPMESLIGLMKQYFVKGLILHWYVVIVPTSTFHDGQQDCLAHTLHVTPWYFLYFMWELYLFFFYIIYCITFIFAEKSEIYYKKWYLIYTYLAYCFIVQQLTKTRLVFSPKIKFVR